MLYIPLYGHQPPSTTRPRLTHPLTHAEIERYKNYLSNYRHLYEPVRSHSQALSLPLPDLKIDRELQINTLPMYKGRIGHRSPIYTANPPPQTTLAFVYSDGYLPTHTPTTPPGRISHSSFIELLRYWCIPLLDALDYILWEYKRTNGLIPINLDPTSLPRTPAVLDWLDLYSRTPVNSTRY